jgi:nicotinamide-nucleotide amidase
MEYLITHTVLPYLQEHFDLDTVLKVRILRTSGVGESQIDERIGDLEELTNPTVGLAAHTGQVDVRIAAKAASLEAAANLIAPVEAEVRKRLGTWIYGVDQESLESVAMRKILGQHWQLVALEAGLAGKLIRRFAGLDVGFLRGEVLTCLPASPDELLAQVQTYRDAHEADVGLGVALVPEGERSYIYLALVSPSTAKKLRLAHAGPPGLAHRRAINFGLDLLRKV